MGLFLSFIGGCEFAYLIEELQSDPDKYLDFGGFYSFTDTQTSDAYPFILEHENDIIEQNPDVIILSQLNDLLRPIQQIQFNQIASKAEQEQQLAEIVRQCEEMINRLSKLNVPIIMQYFPWLRSRMLNLFKPNPDIYNEQQFLRKYVTSMEDLAAKYPTFYFMDLTYICSYYGYWQTFKLTDPPWHTHITQPAQYIAGEFTRWINYVLHRDKKIKCVLVDLDNTMWNGVIRDDGIENLDIRIDRERFNWNVLRILFSRGIMIGVVSKNDPALQEQIETFIKPYLNGTKFVCFELSWEDKYEIVRKVHRELNIGLDSILLIDDSEFERAQVKAMLPEVRVADENIFESLLYLPELQPAFVTEESKKRTDYYIEENKRKTAEQGLSREDFLNQCSFSIKVGRMEPFEVNRVAELIQRTNQLNTSIKRYTKQEVLELENNNNCDIYTVYVSDNFGDYGLVGVCIGMRCELVYEIDTLLFSCRVMSKGVEDYVLTTVLTCAKQEGMEKTVVRFQKTDRNKGMQCILKDNNFLVSAEESEFVVYSFDLHKQEIKALPGWFSQMTPVDNKASVLS